MTKPRLRLVDTASLARHYGVAVGTIHRWAHEDQWVKYGPRRSRLWDMAQVQESYDRRRARDQAAAALNIEVILEVDLISLDFVNSTPVLRFNGYTETGWHHYEMAGSYIVRLDE